MTALTARQKEVLSYLYRCQHSTRNIMRSAWGASPTVTLLALERRGLVTSTYSSSVLSSNVRWTITEQGKQAAREHGAVS